jgi:hypothetical protein
MIFIDEIKTWAGHFKPELAGELEQRRERAGFHLKLPHDVYFRHAC